MKGIAVVASPAVFAALLALSGATTAATAAPAPGACAAVQGRVVDVRDFGARGDGSTDDSQAISSASACAASLFKADAAGRAGVTLYFPRGSYGVARQIRIDADQSPLFGGGIQIVGDGADASRIVATTGAGIFAVTMSKPPSRAAVGLDVRDLGMVAGIADAGTALDVEAEGWSTAEAREYARHLVGLRLRHVDFSASGASRAYFAYGVRATGLYLAFLGDVQMRGAGGVACYAFSYSYGTMVDHSTCEGPRVGVDLINASEGDVVTNSQFRNVAIAIRMRVVPGEVPGPSNDGAVIVGNTISAQITGIDLTWKRFVFIDRNDLQASGRGSFDGVVLANEGPSYVTGNVITGADGTGNGIRLTNDAASRAGLTSAITISRNTFARIGTAVSIGSGVRDTILRSNVFDRKVTPPTIAGWARSCFPHRGIATRCHKHRLLTTRIADDKRCVRRRPIEKAQGHFDRSAGMHGSRRLHAHEMIASRREADGSAGGDGDAIHIHHARYTARLFRSVKHQHAAGRRTRARQRDRIRAGVV